MGGRGREREGDDVRGWEGEEGRGREREGEEGRGRERKGEWNEEGGRERTARERQRGIN